MLLDEPIIRSEYLQSFLRSRLLPPQVMVEIGTGAISTPILVKTAEELALKLYTVDVSPANIEWARELTKGQKQVFPVCAKGEDFLRDFVEQIGFAYLDNYDWVDPGDPDAHKYPRGCSKRESELVHLEQTMELVDLLSSTGMVLFDDTWFLERQPPGSRYLRNKVDFRNISNRQILEQYQVFAKGSLAVPFLLCCGFEVLAVSERPHYTQILLGRPKSPFVEELPYDRDYFSNLLWEHRLARYPARGPLVSQLSNIMRDLRLFTRHLRSRAQLRARLTRFVRALNLNRQP